MHLFITLRHVISTILILCAMLAMPLQASLIRVDLTANSGDQLVMRDTDSGLNWLQLALTERMTYDMVTSSRYMTSDGYRFATDEEILQLYTNVGAQNPPLRDFSSEHFSAVRHLNDTWGMNHIVSGQNAVIGFVVRDEFEWQSYSSIYYLCCSLEGTSFQSTGNNIVGENFNSQDYGFYLVQGISNLNQPESSVPVPTSMVLLLTGVLVPLRRATR